MCRRKARSPACDFWFFLAATVLLVGCGGDDAKAKAKPEPDAGFDAGSGGSDAGVEASPDVAPDVMLPSTPFGPSFVGVAENVDGTTPDDIALGFFFDPAAVTIPHVGTECVAYAWTAAAPPGRDVGEVTVTGGAVVSPVTLARDDNSGSYYLDLPTDAWNPGDDLVLSGDGQMLGPAKVPTEFTSETLSTQSAANRDGALPLVFGGTDASHVAVTMSGSEAGQSYLLVCLAPAAGGSYAVPAEAMGSIPDFATTINVKLSPVSAVQAGDVAFFAAGQAVEADLVVMQ